jgi:hypothetical protein
VTIASGTRAIPRNHHTRRPAIVDLPIIRHLPLKSSRA